MAKLSQPFHTRCIVPDSIGVVGLSPSYNKSEKLPQPVNPAPGRQLWDRARQELAFPAEAIWSLLRS
jgi:hypothetical protein